VTDADNHVKSSISGALCDATALALERPVSKPETPRPKRRRRNEVRRRQRGTGSVRERFPGKWEMRYKHHCEMIGAPTKTEAQDHLEKWVERIKNGGLPKSGTMTFGELSDLYLAARKREVEPTTLAWYRRNFQQHLRPTLDDLLLRDITAAHIEAVLDGARDTSRTTRRGAPLGMTSLRNLLVAVRAVLAWGVKRKHVGENVASDVNLPAATEVAERPFLGVGDVKTFLRATEGTELEAIVATAIFTGLRRSELCALQWGDLDLDERRITVRRAAANVDGKVIVKAPKTRKSRRTDHLSPFVAQVLRHHRDEQQARYLKLGLAARLHGDARKKAFVFDRRDGRQWDPNELSKQFSRLVRSKKLPPLRFHDLRHGFASLAYAAGSSLKVISESLGHSGIAITAKTYVHLFDEGKRERATAFDAYVTSRFDDVSAAKTGA